MKRFMFVMSLVLFLPASVSAEEGLLQKLKGAAQKLIGQGATGGAPAVEKGNIYIIHLTTGGKIETDNYTMEKDRLRMEIPAGTVYVDRSMVKSIEEVAGAEYETVQTIKVQPNPSAQERPERAGQPPFRKKTEAPVPSVSETAKDDNGHDEAWWRARIDEWKKKKAEAEARYNKAQANWNSYHGQLGTVTAGGGSSFDVTRLQDLRGSARVDMDRAKADMDSANNMLDKVLPEEARKAGAPPGWLR